jgi:hypothetical protein
MTSLPVRWRLRRPFSRKIRLGPQAILDTVRRRELMAQLGTTGLRQPVETSVEFLCLLYGADYDAAAQLLERIAASGHVADYSAMLAQTNFRKLLLGCLRERLADKPLPPAAAELLLKFSRVIDPELKRIYPTSASSVDDGNVLRFDYAPLPQKLKVTLLFRKYFFGSDSRLHDMGPRLKAAFDEAGLDCRLVDPNLETFDFAPCDLVLVDDSALIRKDAAKKGEFLDRLRSSAARIGMVDLDHWMAHFGHRLAAGSQRYDFVWSMAPLQVNGGSIDGVRACVIPFPVGVERLLNSVVAGAGPGSGGGLRFCGAIEDYNFHRYFWLLENFTSPHPYEVEVTRHTNDGLSVEDSLRGYLAKLTASRAVLNFTMRADGQRMIVGRTSDVLCAGRLLVQESAADMRRYFNAAAHYVEFSDVDGLREICGRLSGSAAYEEVRREGAAYFAANYSNAAVIRHLATFL